MDESAEAAQNANRRRRDPAHVTSNACNECRKRKSKCDGQDPCARCAAQGNTSCRYEGSSRDRSAALRAENIELRSYRQQSENVFDSLASGEHCDFILGELQNKTSLGDISLGLGQLRPTKEFAASDFNNTPSTTDWPLSEAGDAAERALSLPSRPGPALSNGEDVAMDADVWDNKPWTEVTTDSALIDHLLSLYFCWEYPIFASLSQLHFLADFRAGRRRYCSSLLLTSIMAVGHQFADDSLHSRDTRASDNDFSNEAERLLESEQNNPSLTTIQALGILSIFEASRGRTEHGIFCCGQAARMATDMGLHLNVGMAQLSGAEREVRRATAWGVFALENAWSLILGRIPHLSLKGLLSVKPRIFEIEEKVEWFPYTGQEEPSTTISPQEGNIRSVYLALCGLFEVVHDALYVLYAPGKVLGSREIMGLYARYLAWYSSLPSTLRQGRNYTPAAFFIHTYYNLAVLLLFGPFITLRLVNSDIVPLQLCLQAADTIGSLLNSYRQLYSLRRTPCFIPIIALASSIVYAVQAKTQGTPNGQLLHGMSALQEMTHSHGFAERGVRYLRILEQHITSVAKVPSDRTSAADKESSYQRMRCLVCFIEPKIEDLPPDQADPFDTSIFAPFPGQILPSSSYLTKLRAHGWELVDLQI